MAEIWSFAPILGRRVGQLSSQLSLQAAHSCVQLGPGHHAKHLISNSTFSTRRECGGKNAAQWCAHSLQHWEAGMFSAEKRAGPVAANLISLSLPLSLSPSLLRPETRPVSSARDEVQHLLTHLQSNLTLAENCLSSVVQCETKPITLEPVKTLAIRGSKEIDAGKGKEFGAAGACFWRGRCMHVRQGHACFTYRSVIQKILEVCRINHCSFPFVSRQDGQAQRCASGAESSGAARSVSAPETGSSGRRGGVRQNPEYWQPATRSQSPPLLQPRRLPAPAPTPAPV